MNCPLDHTETERVTYENCVEVDRCPACRGMWLDHGELEQIQDARENDYRKELTELPDVLTDVHKMVFSAAKPLLACPKCQRQMERREYGYCSLILIDACPNGHGVWLQDGEIQALEQFFERSRADTAGIRRGFLASLKELFGR